MVEPQYKLGDWARTFIGDVPGEFYIELIMRGVFFYALLLFSMRMLGKRMASQLNRNELAAMVSLAAAIGMPIQSPERGLLPAVVIAIVIICVSRGISMLIYYSPKAEFISQGNYAELINEGRLQLKTMTEVRISREKLFSFLRERGIRHLGEVKRFYFEAGAKITVVRQQAPAAGLPVIPDWDRDYLERQRPATDRKSCRTCGNTVSKNLDAACENCGGLQWERAIC